MVKGAVYSLTDKGTKDSQLGWDDIRLTERRISRYEGVCKEGDVAIWQFSATPVYEWVCWTGLDQDGYVRIDESALEDEITVGWYRCITPYEEIDNSI